MVRMSCTSAALILLVLLIAFLAIGAAFAISTPAWQAPDEPAHYNYIKFIVEHGALPVLHAGDYDQAYNEDFTRTPRDTQLRSIDPLRYENYSPPLYYLLAAPIYAVTDGRVVAIRLLSVILGGVLIVVAYLIGAELFSTRLEIALGGAAFVAFVPQHVAMLSAVNSDALAELLIALCVYQALRLFRTAQPSQRSLLLLGLTLGLGLLTKSTVYYTALPIVIAALWFHNRRYAVRSTRYALVFVPALTLGALFWLRNLGAYGGLDILGLARHNAIVVGQPTTADWIARYGFADTLWRGLTTTFHSFWGQFGWMAVPMPDSTYWVLGALSTLALAGWGWRLIEKCRMQDTGCRMQVARRIGPHSGSLALLVVLTFGGFIYYNLTFVQHQGRYLFPALIPIGLAFALGIDQWLSKIKAALIKLTVQSKRDLMPWLDEAQWLALALVFLYLARLCVVALQNDIIPNLTP